MITSVLKQLTKQNTKHSDNLSLVLLLYLCRPTSYDAFFLFFALTDAISLHPFLTILTKKHRITVNIIVGIPQAYVCASQSTRNDSDFVVSNICGFSFCLMGTDGKRPLNMSCINYGYAFLSATVAIVVDTRKHTIIYLLAE